MLAYGQIDVMRRMTSDLRINGLYRSINDVASHDRGSFNSVEAEVALSELNGQRVHVDEPHSRRVSQVRRVDPHNAITASQIQDLVLRGNAGMAQHGGGALVYSGRREQAGC